MTIAVGSALSAFLCLAMAIPAGYQLWRGGRTMTGATQVSRRLLAIGVVVCGVSPTIPVVASELHPHLMHVRADRLHVAITSAIICGAGALCLLWGLLLLPGIADSRRAQLRHLLDGLLLAGGFSFVGWAVLVSADRLAWLRQNAACTAIAIPAATAVALLGVVVVAAVRAPRPRGGLGLLSAGVGLVAVGGAATSGYLCLGYGVLVFVAGLSLATGALLVCLFAPAADRVVTTDEVDRHRGHMVFLVLSMGALVLGGICQGIRHEPMHPIATGIGWFTGIVLLSRQALAIREERLATSRATKSEAHFRELAHTDPLTGLANRRGLMKTLREKAVGGPACVLLALDLDGFKTINDMRGHDVGDAVLMEVGRRLRTGLRPGDVAARLGGDEFAVLMWGGPTEAQVVGERLLRTLSAPYEHAIGTVFLSASIGLAGCTTTTDVESLLRNADLALRMAKQRGKARVEKYDPAQDQVMRYRTTLEHELRGAIERDELFLAYQPVVDLPSTRPVGAEALVRWHHPTLGNVSPEVFIPIAEESGMIGQLGLWVLHRACHQLSRWHTDGHDVWVSVNVSVRELHSPTYVQLVTDVLRAHRVPAQRLVLEVTEHQVAVDLDVVVDQLAGLRKAGVRIALDDFGAGYSSLGQLHRLPVDILKIDRELLIQSDPDVAKSAAPLINVVVELGHRLGLKVVAEGVEDVPQRVLLEKMSCPLAQGYLFGMAMPAEHIEARLASAAPLYPHRRAQNVGPVDSGREMRQA